MSEWTHDDRYNVQINDPMFSIHHVVENVTIEDAVKKCKEKAKHFCPHSIFIEKVYLHENNVTQVHESISWYNVLKQWEKRK